MFKDTDPDRKARAIKILTIVALLAIIAWAGVMLVRTWTADTEGDSPRRKQPMYLKCTKCRHEFQISRREFNLQHKDAADSIPGMGHCPECKGRFCSTLMSICRHCKQRVATAVPGEGKNAGKQVCSKCGGVVGQWDRPRD